jgi:hypothetical protein
MLLFTSRQRRLFLVLYLALGGTGKVLSMSVTPSLMLFFFTVTALLIWVTFLRSIRSFCWFVTGLAIVFTLHVSSVSNAQVTPTPTNTPPGVSFQTPTNIPPFGATQTPHPIGVDGCPVGGVNSSDVGVAYQLSCGRCINDIPTATPYQTFPTSVIPTDFLETPTSTVTVAPTIFVTPQATVTPSPTPVSTSSPDWYTFSISINFDYGFVPQIIGSVPVPNDLVTFNPVLFGDYTSNSPNLYAGVSNGGYVGSYVEMFFNYPVRFHQLSYNHGIFGQPSYFRNFAVGVSPSGPFYYGVFGNVNTSGSTFWVGPVGNEFTNPYVTIGAELGGISTGTYAVFIDDVYVSFDAYLPVIFTPTPSPSPYLSPTPIPTSTEIGYVDCSRPSDFAPSSPFAEFTPSFQLVGTACMRLLPTIDLPQIGIQFSGLDVCFEMYRIPNIKFLGVTISFTLLLIPVVGWFLSKLLTF